METGVTMESLLTSIGSFLTSAVGWMGEVLDFVVERPVVLLFVVAAPLAGWAFGGLKRLIRL